MASEEGDCKFLSKLDERSKEKAKAELHELNNKDREIAVQTFRKWVNEQDWMTSPTDFEFLLRYLRVRKFSQLGARQTLENYWKCKSKMPKFHKNIDPADPIIQEVIRTGWVFGHTKADSEGQRLLYNFVGKMTLEQMKGYGVHTLYKALVLVLEWLMFDENAQVNGVRMIVDFTDMSFQHYLAYANFEDQQNLLKFMQKALPIRIKGIYFYNEPTFMDVFMGFFSQFMTPKFKDRISFVGKNLVNLYEVVDKSMLPTEYLPDDFTGPSAGSMDTVIDEMLEDMQKPPFRDYIRKVTSSDCGIDFAKRKNMDDEPAASFRKLNVE